MVWKIPRGGAQQDQVVLEEAKLKEILRKQLTTSYQVREGMAIIFKNVLLYKSFRFVLDENLQFN